MAQSVRWVVLPVMLAAFVECSFHETGYGQSTDSIQWLRRAEDAARHDRSREAVELADEAIRRDASLADAFYLRGRERFRCGDFAGSVSDFDRFIELRPAEGNRLWERGISCYYAQQFEAGAAQFAAYQQFDNRDVENAVWHVMCLSRIHGLAEARRQLLPVQGDRRVPMAEIYRLFRGDGSAGGVLQAAGDTNLSDAERRLAQFYAHLYLGLFQEISGNEAEAREHLTTAAEKYRMRHYMWDVARVHAQRWAASPPRAAETDTP